MKLQITIDGKKYEADIEVLEEERTEALGTSMRPPPRVEGHRSAHAAAVPPAHKAKVHTSTASDDKVCKSSIAGIVFKVLVAVGQTVSAGETVIVLEAMKMESNVNSPVAGVIKTILVAPGDSVKKGQVLLEFE
jgi:methylmalonyl-CoA carboxyltransferase small subunit